MEQRIRVSPKGRLRNNTNKTQKEEVITISNAYYLGNMTLLLTFSNGVQKRLDFTTIFQHHLKGYYEQFSNPSKFKRFVLANGNISWGKNEDVIFPVSFLYNHPKAKKEKEEVLYVI